MDLVRRRRWRTLCARVQRQKLSLVSGRDRQKAGRITAGITKEVSFEPVDGPINELIDGAYKVKYKGSPYLAPMTGKSARAATIKVIPRE